MANTSDSKKSTNNNLRRTSFKDFTKNLTGAFDFNASPTPQIPETRATGQKFVSSLSIGDWFGARRRKYMRNGSAEVEIGEEQLYRGFGFGIIRSVINTGVITAEENIRTTCSSIQREILARDDSQIEHPYITLYRNSPFFSEYDFWKQFLLYIQLKGEFFIYMNRKKLSGQERYRPGTRNLCSKTAYMKIINPYEMSPKEYDDDGNVKVWLRTIKTGVPGKSIVQEYQAHEIIRVTEINPWNQQQCYSLLDAVKENLFTLENARDFTRHALVNNQNSPGILSVNGEFPTQEDFDNYIAMLKDHEEGEMIVAAGNAETTYQEMTQNLDGTSQERIRSTERDEILVATGTSKSILGIETTGLTRDVAATQKMTFVERTVVPYVKLLIETLNYDYRKYYAADFAIDKYIMRVTTPSVSDKAQELKELEIREEEYNLVQRFVNRGYTRKSAAQYVRGEIDVEQLQLDNGDKAKLSPSESIGTTQAVMGWQQLIAAGNDPQSVVDLVDGKITMAEFLLINKDVKPSQPASQPLEDESSGDNEEEETPTEYDPDAGDYGTPRDEKEGAEQRNAILTWCSQQDYRVTADDISKNFPDQDLSDNLLNSIEAFYLDKKRAESVDFMVNERGIAKDKALAYVNGDDSNIPKALYNSTRNHLSALDYAKINKDIINI